MLNFEEDKTRILIVDDEVEITSLSTRFLGQLLPQIAIDTSNDPEEALKLVLSNRYTIIVSDYAMPQMNGVELFNKVKRLLKTQNCPAFIIFTGQSREQIAIEALNAGVDFYLQKGDPIIAFKQLSGFITHALNLRNEKNKRESVERVLNDLNELVAFQDKNGLIIWANMTSAKSVMESLENVVGHHCYEVWHNRTSRCENCPVAVSFQTGEIAEGEMTTPDGRHWRIKGNPVKDINGKVVGVVEMGLDVTFQKKALDAYNDHKIQVAKATELLVTFLNEKIFSRFNEGGEGSGKSFSPVSPLHTLVNEVILSSFIDEPQSTFDIVSHVNSVIQNLGILGNTYSALTPIFITTSLSKADVVIKYSLFSLLMESKQISTRKLTILCSASKLEFWLKEPADVIAKTSEGSELLFGTFNPQTFKMSKLSRSFFGPMVNNLLEGIGWRMEWLKDDEGVFVWL